MAKKTLTEQLKTINDLCTAILNVETPKVVEGAYKIKQIASDVRGEILNVNSQKKTQSKLTAQKILRFFSHKTPRSQDLTLPKKVPLTAYFLKLVCSIKALAQEFKAHDPSLAVTAQKKAQVISNKFQQMQDRFIKRVGDYQRGIINQHQTEMAEREESLIPSPHNS